MTATNPRAPGTTPAAGAIDGAIERLAGSLDAGRRGDPGRLSAALRAEPLRSDLRAVLARLDSGALLRVAHGLALPDVPDAAGVLAGLFAGGDGEGHALRARIEASHRHALLERIFHPDRVRALRRACRTTPEEATP